MPVVQVNMLEGRTVEQKAKLITLLTQAFEEIGVNPHSLTIILHDIPKTNWSLKGKHASQKHS
jgi:4-oxalocrotonate tautomerase